MVGTIHSGNNSGLESEGTGNDELDEAIEIAGYLYDPKEDIFYSKMDPWQRHIGYCRLYDEAAAPLGMIIDCEPVRFEYKGKKWLVEFWKGQYDLVTGCEIGIYIETLAINLPGLFSGTFYHSADNSEMLQMVCTLKKNGKALFTREEKHWWLTGFKLGEFSEPSQLVMDVKITFEDIAMRDEFVNGLEKAGYAKNQLQIDNANVSFTFDVPHTRPPITRTKETDWIIQRKNEEMCNIYKEITGPYNTVQDKVDAIEHEAPELYAKLMNFGKNKKTYQVIIALTLVSSLIVSFVKLENLIDPSN